MGIAIEIEGIDKTSLVQQKQLSITDELNSRNTYDFDIVDQTGAYRPVVGQEAIVYSEEHYNDARDIGDGTFARASVAYQLDGSQVLSGIPRYETGQFGQAIMVEEGTINQLPLANDWTSYDYKTAGFAITGDDAAYAPYSALADKIAMDAGSNYIYKRKSGLPAITSQAWTFSAKVYAPAPCSVFISINDILTWAEAWIEKINLVTGWNNIKVTRTFGATISTSIDCNLSNYDASAGGAAGGSGKGAAPSGAITFWILYSQLEQKAFATSWIDSGVTRVDETLTIPTTGILSAVEGEFSIYFKAPDYTFASGYIDIIDIRLGAVANRFLILRKVSNGTYGMYLRNNSAYSLYTFSIPADTWTRLTWVWKNGGNYSFLVNGVSVQTGAYVTGDLSFDNVYFAGGIGYFDDLRISSIARTDAEILAGYNSGAALPIDQYTTAKMAFDSTLEIFARPILYAGTIDDAYEYSPNNDRTDALAYKLKCVDYNQLCSRFLIAEAYESHLAGDIVKHIIDDFINATTPGEDVTYTNVQDGPTISKAVFNYIYATQALDELAEIAGFNWWVDYSKDMHFCSRLTNAAPFSLTDASNNFRGFRIRHTRQDYRNKQYFRGGQDISSALTETFKGDSENITFVLTLPCAKVPSSVTVDAAAKTIGIRQVESGKDFYWSEGDREITQDAGAAKLAAANTLSVTYQGYFPIIVESFNESAIAERQAVEGGTGIYEHAVTDTSINTSDAVQERAEALVRKYGEIPETIEFETDSDGLKAGQLITVNLTKHAVNSAYLIQRVTIRDITANILRYQVTALSGENIGGWVDFFKKLAKAGQGYVIRENEVLLKIRKLTDNLRLTDTLTVTSGSPVGIVGTSLVGYCESGG